MKKSSVVHKLNKPVRPVVSVIVLIGFLLLVSILVVGSNSLVRSKGSYAPPTIRTEPIHSPTPKLPARYTSTPTQPLYTTYTSPTLGIRFSYINVVGGAQSIYTKEIGNKVYLYYTFDNQKYLDTDDEFLQKIAPQAKYVEVFYKDPQLSLQEAIKHEFLAGYSENSCFVVKARIYAHRADETFVTAGIYFHQTPNMTAEQIRSAIAKCPSYTSAYSISYFMMNPKRPNKFLYIKLGQDNIPSGIKDYAWDGTIEVL